MPLTILNSESTEKHHIRPKLTKGCKIPTKTKVDDDIPSDEDNFMEQDHELDHEEEGRYTDSVTSDD